MSGWYVLADEGRTEVAGPFPDREAAETEAESMESDGGIEYEVAYVNDDWEEK